MDTTELLSLFNNNKFQAWNYRYRRHMDWTETYTLYRDKVFINSLTQRQSVNVPLMKTAIQTLLKENDDPAVLYFSDKGNDSQREVYYNEVWNKSCTDNKFIIQDQIDKKQGFSFGRTFQKQTIKNGRHWWEVRDPQWILVDRFVNPAILDSAQFIYDTSNFVPLSLLETIDYYDQKEVKKLKEYHAKQAGIVAADNNLNLAYQQAEKMMFMGVPDAANPVLGETYVELIECYQKLWNPDHNQYEIRFIVIADGMAILLNEWQEQVIGKTNDNYWRDHFIYSSWGTDPERQDFWSDGVGDVLRTPNKVLNVWASQMIENRTMRSFGMRFYDNGMEANQQYIPQTLDPRAGGLYGIPVPAGKNIGDVLQDVKIEDLSNSLPDIQYVTGFAEKASAATSTSQGAVEAKQYTLGEIQLSLVEAKDRAKASAPLYTDSRLEFGVKFTKLLEASKGLIDPIEITKKGRQSDRNYTRIITPDDWYSPDGMLCDVKDVTTSSGKELDALQILNAALNSMPNNKPLRRIYNQHLVSISHTLTANEVKEVMEYERQQEEAAAVNAQAGTAVPADGANQLPSGEPSNPMMQQPGAGAPMAA